MQLTDHRPQVHFTPPGGWLNDPHGICFVDGRYHLFYQYNPQGLQWSAQIQWGHAISPDLVHWEHQPVALVPRPDEAGCWSGTTVLDGDELTIVYTSVTPADLDLGRIALAHPDRERRHWRSFDGDIVIRRPPANLHADVFRDPCILRVDDRWTMVVGAGVAGGDGMAVQYHSADLRTWTYDGVLASRPSTATDGGVWTGAMWECPQLVRVGDTWALLVSVWEDGRLYYVAGATGSYDGIAFVADRWERLTYDDIGYAMTSFLDRRGRPCVMAWLREEAGHDLASAEWTGALSLPMTIDVDERGGLRLWPHPDVDALRDPTPVLQEVLAGGLIVQGDATGLDLELPADGGTWALAVSNTSSGALARISLVGPELTIQRPGHLDTVLPTSGDRVRVIVDAGILGIYPGRGCSTVRLPSGTDVQVGLDGRTTGPVTVHRLLTGG